MNPNAAAFVPRRPVVLRSSRYMGRAEDYDHIKNVFAVLRWPSEVHTIFVTNGWHEGFENGRWVNYCGYCCNDDNEIGKRHFYQ